MVGWRIGWALVLVVGVGAQAQESRVVIERGNSTIVLEPYAPSIVRVTLSLLKEPALGPPGYGFSAKPSAAGWSHQHDEQGDTYRSDRLIVHLAANKPGRPVLSQIDIAKYFNGSAPGAHLAFSTAEGEKLLDMEGWAMAVPNHKDGTASVVNDKRPGDADFYQVGATFASPADEHYYGLGQNQEGFLDHRGHPVHSWHDYAAPSGATVGVPFLVTNKGYGLIWDNPSKTTITPGFNERTNWISQVGRRVSYFVIAGASTDEIYAGYRALTGATPLLPKAALTVLFNASSGIQARRAAGCGERAIVSDTCRRCPCGRLVLLHENGADGYGAEGLARSAGMNKQLHDMGFQTMISVWPRFVKESGFYDLRAEEGLVRTAGGWHADRWTAV